jgi:hypothetical protein
MAVVMVVVLLMSSLVANSTFTETGARLKGPGSRRKLGGWLEILGKTKNGLSRTEAGDLPQQPTKPTAA